MSRMPLIRPGSSAGASLGAVVRTLCTLGALVSGAASAQSAIDVNLQDGRLTMRFDAVPAERLAEALHRETGIAFVVTGEPGTPLSGDFVDEPLDKAIALLSPNHLLVREDARPDAPIVEVVMMMPDGTNGGGSTEFLPSGGPSDEENFNAEPGGLQDEFEDIEYDENGLPIDPATLRDPGRADAVRGTALEPELDETGRPVDDSSEGFDPQPEFDPDTGEILQPR